MSLAGVELHALREPTMLDTTLLRRLDTNNHTSAFEHFVTACEPQDYGLNNRTRPLTYHNHPPQRVSLKTYSMVTMLDNIDVTWVIVSCNNAYIADALCRSITVKNLSMNVTETDDCTTVLREASVTVDTQTTATLFRIAELLSELKYLVRQEPSWSALNYMLYLQDHLDLVRRSLKSRQMGAGNRPHQASISLPQHADDIHHITRLLNTTIELVDELARIYATNKDQLASKDSAKNKLFAVLAAVYLPFTLASSMLGMNVRGLQDGTNAFWYTFLAIALPLATVTVAFPLTFERTYRRVQSLRARHPLAFKRTILSTAVLVVIAALVTTIIVVTVTITSSAQE